uniref:Tyrosine--tRNA ligase n=1 Tax=Paulinella chromatophora TaxID=39717 RepID=B1X5B0_PAUCH|nr:tyrosyl-tRNA synthetase [Paulinella chromatophora]ACB43129.1 tyrosyl-tRNA synthetase [Paulinella chromatophora]
MKESTSNRILPKWLMRGIVDLFPSASEGSSDQIFQLRLSEAEKFARPLRVKLGIDPTGTDIHLGHSILFRKLRAFQDAGHIAVLIIGDFTARIGDPTGKNTTRVQLSIEEVEANAQTYLQQLGKDQPKEKALLDFETPGRLEVYQNSTWLGEMDLLEIIKLLGTATVGQMLAKEDFANRYKLGTPIALHEFLYPLLQGYDSVAIRADVELGGTDQRFNVAIGRDLQRYYGQRPQFCLLLPILPGLDGVQKMSKSLHNTVNLTEDALSMYSKLEKLPDNVVNQYLTLLTDIDLANLVGTPRERQKRMAFQITANWHGDAAASAAQLDAAKLVVGIAGIELKQNLKEVSLNEVKFPAKAFYLLSAVGICASSSEARRKIQGGGVRLDGEKIIDPNQEFAKASDLSGKVLQLGKKIFRRLILS